MTLQDLNCYFRLLEQLHKAQELLASLECAAAIQSPKLDGLPRAPGFGDSVGRLAAEIADMRARVEYLENELTQKRRDIERYIDSVPDDQTRLILRLRFLRGMSWGRLRR